MVEIGVTIFSIVHFIHARSSNLANTGYVIHMQSSLPTLLFAKLIKNNGGISKKAKTHIHDLTQTAKRHWRPSDQKGPS